MRLHVLKARAASRVQLQYLGTGEKRGTKGGQENEGNSHVIHSAVQRGARHDPLRSVPIILGT